MQQFGMLRNMVEEQNNRMKNGRHSQFTDRDVSCRHEDYESREPSATQRHSLVVYLLPDSSQQRPERIISQVYKKSTVFYGKRKFIIVFSKDHYLSLSWATWTHALALKSILILSYHLHLVQPRTLFSSSFRTTLINPLLLTYHMSCPFYRLWPSHPKIIRWRIQIKNLLNLQFRLS